MLLTMELEPSPIDPQALCARGGANSVTRLLPLVKEMSYLIMRTFIKRLNLLIQSSPQSQIITKDPND